MPSGKYGLVVGNTYSRAEIADAAGIDEKNRRGDYQSGYPQPLKSQNGDATFFVFANVGGAGRLNCGTQVEFPSCW